MLELNNRIRVYSEAYVGIDHVDASEVDPAYKRYVCKHLSAHLKSRCAYVDGHVIEYVKYFVIHFADSDGDRAIAINLSESVIRHCH